MLTLDTVVGGPHFPPVGGSQPPFTNAKET